MIDKQAKALRYAELLEHEAKEHGSLDYKYKAADELRRLHARVVELEAEVQELRKVKDAGIDRIADLTAQLEAIGAGGVESLRKKGNA